MTGNAKIRSEDLRRLAAARLTRNLAALPAPPADPPAPVTDSSSSRDSTWGPRLRLWSSPSDQPGWARPALLVITALAVLSYTWHMGTTIEIYYAAAVRSMSQSWHDFFFGAFDPAGTVTVDKLPGAMWVQALVGAALRLPRVGDPAASGG